MMLHSSFYTTYSNYRLGFPEKVFLISNVHFARAALQARKLRQRVNHKALGILIQIGESVHWDDSFK